MNLRYRACELPEVANRPDIARLLRIGLGMTPTAMMLNLTGTQCKNLFRAGHLGGLELLDNDGKRTMRYFIDPDSVRSLVEERGTAKRHVPDKQRALRLA